MLVVCGADCSVCPTDVDERQEEKGTAEGEMVGWHYRFNGYEFEHVPGHSEGQESLACCSPWGHKDLDMTELNFATKLIPSVQH